MTVKLANDVTLSINDKGRVYTAGRFLALMEEVVWMFEGKKRMDWKHNCGHYTATVRDGRRIVTKITFDGKDLNNDQWLAMAYPLREAVAKINADAILLDVIRDMVADKDWCLGQDSNLRPLDS